MQVKIYSGKFCCPPTKKNCLLHLQL